MKKLSSIVLLLMATIIFFSCEKEDETKIVGSLYGTVTDKATGEPITNAKIELMPTGLSVKTGDDGNYEFPKVETGTYNIYVTKSGYLDYKTNDIEINENNADKPVNIQIEKMPPALQVVDDAGKEINAIDFGDIEGDVMRSFNIFNNSETSLEWEIVYESNWIKSFSKLSGVLVAGKTQTIVVKINRTELISGQNSTVVHLVSDNGSKQLTITAISISLIETLAISEITPTSAVLNGRFNKQTPSPILEYGFVYGSMPTPTLDNGATKVIVKGTAHIGNFSYAISELTDGETYFVRAFATTENEELYGETCSFTAQEVQYVTLLSANLMVQKTDLGYVDWYSAKTMCESSVVGGFSDWRLPTIEELMTLYTERTKIGGFSNNFSYWSSSKSNSYVGAYYYIDFYNGKISVESGSYRRHVRAVRTLK